MSLAASHEDSKEAVASHQGLKRLVKGERKRSFTPDIEPSHSKYDAPTSKSVYSSPLLAVRSEMNGYDICQLSKS